eukprot:EG_transcript_7482
MSADALEAGSADHGARVRELLAAIGALDAQLDAAQRRQATVEAERRRLAERRAAIAAILAAAGPLLRETQEALQALSPEHIDEVRALHCPPAILQRAVTVLYGVLECRTLEPQPEERAALTWAAVKPVLCPNLLHQLEGYDPHLLSGCGATMDWLGTEFLGVAVDPVLGLADLSDLSDLLHASGAVRHHIAQRLARRAKSKSPPPAPTLPSLDTGVTTPSPDPKTPTSPKAKGKAKPKGGRSRLPDVPARGGNGTASSRSRSHQQPLIRAASVPRAARARLRSASGGAMHRKSPSLPLTLPVLQPPPPPPAVDPRVAVLADCLSEPPSGVAGVEAEEEADLLAELLPQRRTPTPPTPCRLIRQPSGGHPRLPCIPVASSNLLDDLLGELPPDEDEEPAPITPNHRSPSGLSPGLPGQDPPPAPACPPKPEGPQGAPDSCGEALTVGTVTYANKTCGVLFRWCLSQLQYAGLLRRHGSTLEEGRELDRCLIDAGAAAGECAIAVERLAALRAALLGRLQRLLDAQYLATAALTVRQKIEADAQDEWEGLA